MFDFNTLKIIYGYQLTEGCNGFNCMSQFCANSPNFKLSNIDDVDNLTRNHEKEPHICPYLSPLIKSPSIYGKIEKFRSFYEHLTHDDIYQTEGLKSVLSDIEAFQHILYSEDRPLTNNDLVLDDDECDSFRQALVRNESKLMVFQSNFLVLIQKMKASKFVDSFHYIRGLIVATLFHNFLNFKNFIYGIYRFVTILFDVADINRFVHQLKKLPKTFKSFVFLIQSNLSSYIIQNSSATLEDKIIQKLCRLLQILSNINDKISPLCFVNDLVTSLFDIEKENRIWKTGKFTFAVYKSVLSWDKRIDFLRKIKDLGTSEFKLNIDRNNLANDSLHLLKLNNFELKKKICVKFTGEDGIDMGGLTKEYFHLISSYITNPANYLFDLIEDRHFWFSTKKYEDMSWYKLMGIIMGLSLHNKIMLPIRFPKLLYKKLCSNKIGLRDLEEIKPDIVKQLENLGDFIDDAELYFSVTSFVNGKLTDIDLIEDGSNIKVNRDNYKKYIKLIVEYYGKKEIAEQFENFQNGFQMVIDYEIGFWFNDVELDLIISGSDEYDWVTFQLATEYEGYVINDQTVIDFWKIFQEYSHDKKLKMLFYVTGSQVIPFGGIEKSKIKIFRTTNLEMLPEAHTCTKSLILPDYKNYKILKKSLDICIEYCEGFGFK